MKNILFLPNYLGGGFAHIGRCLALADEWTLQGGKAFFAINGPHAHRVKEAGYEYHIIDTPRMRAPASRAPAYVYVAGMDYQVARDGFDHPAIVERSMQEARKIIDLVKPDALLGDGCLTTWLIGRRAGLPVVQIVKSSVRPEADPLVWWESAPPGFIPPNTGPVFNPLMEKLGLPPIARAEDLLQGDLLLIPSIPELDPVKSLQDNTFYIGSLARRPAETSSLPDWLISLDRTKSVIYITVGGAAGNGGAPEFFNLVNNAVGGMDCRFVVSTGGKTAGLKNNLLAPNINMQSWVPNWALLPMCHAVIFHGGYTRIEILGQGLPSIVIPFHSEQEHYGRRMEALGCALCLPYSDAPYVRKVVRWRGGGWLGTKRFTVHFRPAPTLAPEALRQAVEQVLTDTAMRNKASGLQEALEGYGGSEQAVDLIRSTLNL